MLSLDNADVLGSALRETWTRLVEQVSTTLTALRGTATARRCTIVTAVRADRCAFHAPGSTHRQQVDSVFEEPILGLLESLLHLPLVVNAAHPEVGEVVKVITKDRVAILHIFLRVEDMLVPEPIDLLRRNDGVPVRVPLKIEEDAINFRHFDDLLERPTLTLLLVHQLHHDGFEVEIRDALTHHLHFASCQHFPSLQKD